ncbi:MAG: hypothetical protein P8124_05710 [Gammaproteobacteria bacterium]
MAKALLRILAAALCTGVLLGWCGGAAGALAVPQAKGTIMAVDPWAHTVQIGKMQCRVAPNALIKGVAHRGKKALQDLYPGLRVRYAASRTPQGACVVTFLWVINSGGE